MRLRVRPGKFRGPDLLVLLSAADLRGQNRFWEGADLALEVDSEDKPERDLVDKRGDYAEARVPEYWVVNPQTKSISVLRLAGDAYEEAGVYRPGQSATSALRVREGMSLDRGRRAGRVTGLFAGRNARPLRAPLDCPISPQRAAPAVGHRRRQKPGERLRPEVTARGAGRREMQKTLAKCGNWAGNKLRGEISLYWMPGKSAIL